MLACGVDIMGVVFNEAFCCWRPGVSFVTLGCDTPSCDAADIDAVLKGDKKELGGKITVGRAGTDSCVARETCSNALAKSFTVGKRCCGSFAKAEKITASTSCEMPGTFPYSEQGVEIICWVAISNREP